MKTIIFLLLAIFLISGCKTPAIITGTATETQYRDTTIYVDVPVYVDTTIYVPIPGFKDSVRIRDSVRVVNGLAYIETVHKEAGIIGVDVSLYKSNLFIDAYLTDSTVLYNLRDTFNFQDSIKIYNALKDKVTTNTVLLPPVKFIPKFYKFAFWVFIAELFILFLLIMNKLGYFGVFTNIIKKRFPFSK